MVVREINHKKKKVWEIQWIRLPAGAAEIPLALAPRTDKTGHLYVLYTGVFIVQQPY